MRGEFGLLMKSILKKLYRLSPEFIMCLGFWLLGIYPFILWVHNPELTEMQIFLISWREELAGLILLLMGGYLFSRKF